MQPIWRNIAPLLRYSAPLASRGSAACASSQRWLAIRADTGDETHDDFKPKYKESPVSDVEDQIKKDITANRVFVYMKGAPNAPQCGFSRMVCAILDAYGVQYGSRNVLADAELREGIKQFTSWPTIPQVFVNGEFVGGSDILMGMHQSGELEKVLHSSIPETDAANVAQSQQP